MTLLMLPALPAQRYRADLSSPNLRKMLRIGLQVGPDELIVKLPRLSYGTCDLSPRAEYIRRFSNQTRYIDLLLGFIVQRYTV